MGVGGQRHAPAALPPGKRPGTHRTGGRVGARPVWTGAENLASTGIRSPDRPARTQSLYRLGYPGPPGSFYCTFLPFLFVRTAPPSRLDTGVR